MASPAKVWFVAGASSGFGRAVVEHALQQGDNVVAIISNPIELSDVLENYASQLLVLSVDVKDPDQTQAAFENAIERFGHVDIVLNNAGLCIIGEAEGMSEEQGREMFETLFWGAVNVSKEAVKTFRDRNSPSGGRLLQVSSCTALKAVAGIAHYAAAYATDLLRDTASTKSMQALECFSHGMSVELDPSWNIKISVIQPAPFLENSPCSIRVDPVHSAYSNPDLPSRVTRNLYPGKSAVHGHGGDPKKFAQVMHRLAYTDGLPFFLPVHRAAVGAAKAKGEELIQAAEDYASWSDDVYLTNN